MELKLEFGDWLDKYFEKDDDLLNEYDKYLSGDINSHVGLGEYIK